MVGPRMGGVHVLYLDQIIQGDTYFSPYRSDFKKYQYCIDLKKRLNSGKFAVSNTHSCFGIGRLQRTNPVQYEHSIRIKSRTSSTQE